MSELKREAYQKLINEDIALLNEMMPTCNLERQHMIHVLEWSVKAIYDENWRLRTEQAEKQLAEVRDELKRFRSAAEILGPIPPTENQSEYITWLEGKVRQLQLREQTTHELGRDYGKPKLENRELKAELAAKDADNQKLEHILSDQANAILSLNVEMDAKDARIKELQLRLQSLTDGTHSTASSNLTRNDQS